MSADDQRTLEAIREGRSAIEKGDLADARRWLSDIDHFGTHYLIALVDLAEGKVDAAEIALRRALELAPDFRQASIALGRLLIDGGRWDEALSHYAALAELDPDSLHARFGLGTAELNRGDIESAEARFDALIREGNDRPEIRFMRARARLELNRIQEGIDDLKSAHRRQPSAFTLKALAGVYWMRADQKAFALLLDKAGQDPGLVVMAADLLRQSGDADGAIQMIERIASVDPLQVDASVVLAQSYIDTGDAAASEQTSRACLAGNPHEPAIQATFISALLMQGKGEEALSAVQPLRHTEPDRQHWIAYEATALRLMGDSRYDSLVDMDRFVRAYELSVPPGYDSMSSFNAALAASLDELHEYAHHPLDQSLRHGSQTSRDLTGVDAPVIRAYIAALDDPIRRYMRDVGTGPEHPLTARNTGRYRIAGSWSVKLSGGGRHVNHVHPEGWISSAYYVVVPQEVNDDVHRHGWIKFGEPPFKTVPPTPPEKWVKPEAGLVVLFPSFLWHGTAPISEGSVRVTAPFDVVPD